MTKKSLKNISIFGDGHLATFLKPILKENEISFNTFGRSAHHDNQINLSEAYFGDDLEKKLEKTHDTVIYMIPPHENTINVLKTLAKKNPYLIFVSSTSVYGYGEVDESSPINPQTKNGLLLQSAEKNIIDNFSSNHIIRPGGLVDHLRNPKKFIKPSYIIRDKTSKINFIHTEDLARFILFLIKYPVKNHITNLNTYEDLTKEYFYQNIFKNHKDRPQMRDEFYRSINSLHLAGYSFYLKYPKVLDIIK